MALLVRPFVVQSARAIGLHFSPEDKLDELLLHTSRAPPQAAASRVGVFGRLADAHRCQFAITRTICLRCAAQACKGGESQKR